MTKINLGEWLAYARLQIMSVSDTPGLEVQALCASILQRPRSWILSHPERILSKMEIDILNDGVNHLLKGVPLPYITGYQSFFGIDIFVSPDVLIPRPETELLVQEALDWLRCNPKSRLAADIGTGSGCIAVSLAKTVPDIKVTAIDTSFSALLVAKKNIQAHRVQEQINLVCANLVNPILARFDLVCANLPYIPDIQLDDLKVSQFEPRQALDGGSDGLRLIRILLNQVQNCLANKALVLLEIESNQGQAAWNLAKDIFPSSKIEILKDLANLPRLVKINRE